MKTVTPFPTFSILIPEDLLEIRDNEVISYWKRGDSCLLQLSSLGTRVQQSAREWLFERTMNSGRWMPFEFPRQPQGCESAAATMSVEDASYVQVYLVWPAFVVHATVSHRAGLDLCQWAWDSLASVRPCVIEKSTITDSVLRYKVS